MRSFAIVMASAGAVSVPALAGNTLNVPADFATIQDAIVAAADGDTVLVAPGGYLENIDFLGKAIHLLSEGGLEVTAIDGGAVGPVVTFANGEGADSIIEGFRIVNGSGACGSGISLGAGASPTIRSNFFTLNIGASGNSGAIGQCTTGSELAESPTIEDNLFTGNTPNGVFLQGVDVPMIDGNEFIDAQQYGIVILGFDSATVSNNVGSGGGEGGMLAEDGAAIDIVGNNFSNNGDGIFNGSEAGILVLSVASVTVNDNICELNGREGIGIQSTSSSIVGGGNVVTRNGVTGLDIQFAQSVSLTGNRADSNEFAGISVFTSATTRLVNNVSTRNADTGINTWLAGNVSVVNCTSALNGFNGIVSRDNNSTVVTNTVSRLNTGVDLSWFIGEGPEPVVTYSNMLGWPGEGNTVDTPIFADAENGDFRPDPCSSLIDAGNSDVVVAVIDVDGNDRIVDDPCSTDAGIGSGAIVDIGAYEYPETLPCPTCETPTDDGQVRAIFSTLFGAPNAMVPGLEGAGFASIAGGPVANPNGEFWTFAAFDDGSPQRWVLIAGGGTDPADAELIFREDDQAPFAGAGETYSFPTTQKGVSDLGQVAFGTNLDNADTASDEYLLLWDQGSVEVLVQEGDPVPGVAGEFYGDSLGNLVMASDGTYGFEAESTVGAQSDTNDNFLIFDDAILAQAGVTVPVGASAAWQGFDFADFSINADGTRYCILGDTLNPDTVIDDVLVVDGEVVLREGVTFGDFTSVVSFIFWARMSPNGDWYAVGRNADGIDWIIRNGEVLAEENGLVPGGEPGERFLNPNGSAIFFLAVSNINGDFLFGGRGLDPSTDEVRDVVILNNQEIVLQNGEAVDLDGNGVFDDGAFIDEIRQHEAFFAADGTLYMMMFVSDEFDASLGDAFAYVQFPVGVDCPGDLTGDSVVDSADLNIVLGSFGVDDGGDLDGDGKTNSTDLNVVLGAFGTACG